MPVFNSYVKLPEANCYNYCVCVPQTPPIEQPWNPLDLLKAMFWGIYWGLAAGWLLSKSKTPWNPNESLLNQHSSYLTIVYHSEFSWIPPKSQFFPIQWPSAAAISLWISGGHPALAALRLSRLPGRSGDRWPRWAPWLRSAFWPWPRSGYTTLHTEI